MAYILPRDAAMDVRTACDSLHLLRTLRIAAFSGLPLKYCRALLLRFTEILLHLSLRHPRWIFPWGHLTKHMQKLSLFQCPLFIPYILSSSTHISHLKVRSPRQTAHIAYFRIICSILPLFFFAFGRNIFQKVCSYLLFFFLLRWWEAKFYIHT